MGFYNQNNFAYQAAGQDREYSITTGMVKENWDKDHPGMVKAEYFLGEKGKNVTGWIPVAVPYAGKDYGSYMLPEVGDMVVIAFERGERNCPIVIGSLWSRVNTIPAETAMEKNNVKRFITRGGCQIFFDDEDGKNQIRLNTPKNLQLLIEDEKQTITLTDENGKNGLVVDCQNGTVTIKADKKIELAVGSASVVIDGSAGKVTASGNTVELSGNQNMNLKGGNTNLTGTNVSVKGNAGATFESSAVTQIKGSMVKIN